MGLDSTRSRGRQIFGSAKYFCPNLLKLTRKISLSEMIKTFFWKPHKNHVYFGKEKVKFGHISTDSLLHRTTGNKGAEASVPKFCGILRKFLEILPGFLTNQNFWGCTCTPINHCRNWPRDQVLRLHNCCTWY